MFIWLPCSLLTPCWQQPVDAWCYITMFSLRPTSWSVLCNHWHSAWYSCCCTSAEQYGAVAQAKNHGKSWKIVTRNLILHLHTHHICSSLLMAYNHSVKPRWLWCLPNQSRRPWQGARSKRSKGGEGELINLFVRHTFFNQMKKTLVMKWWLLLMYLNLFQIDTHCPKPKVESCWTCTFSE